MKLAIVQRDGVVSRANPPQPGRQSDKLTAIPGSIAALALLSQADLRVILISREARIGVNIERIHAWHEQIRHRVEEAGGEIDACCSIGGRKSLTLLLADIARRYRTGLDGVPVFGDNRHTLSAAANVGARPILVRTGQGAKTIGELANLEGVTIYGDFAGAVDAWRLARAGA